MRIDLHQPRICGITSLFCVWLGVIVAVMIDGIKKKPHPGSELALIQGWIPTPVKSGGDFCWAERARDELLGEKGGRKTCFHPLQAVPSVPTGCQSHHCDNGGSSRDMVSQDRGAEGCKCQPAGFFPAFTPVYAQFFSGSVMTHA